MCDGILVDHSSKDPHRFVESRVRVRRFDGSLVGMDRASDFVSHLSRIDCYRVYAERELRSEVAQAAAERWG